MSLKNRLIRFYSQTGSKRQRKISSQLKSLLNVQEHFKRTSLCPPTPQWIYCWKDIQNKIFQFHKTNDCILHLQANARWTTHGERPTKAFYNSVKSRRLATSISTLDSPAGLVSSPDLVNRVIHSFYQQLYSSDSTCPPEFPLALPAGLSLEESSSLVAPITPKDIVAVIKKLPNNKSPGPDGIPYEFFKKNLKQLMKILIPMYNDMISRSSIIPDSGNVITVLL